MKLLKKLTALALSATLALSAMAPALAAEGDGAGTDTEAFAGRITINHAQENATYHAYKLLDLYPLMIEVQTGDTQSQVYGFYETSPWKEFFLQEETTGEGETATTENKAPVAAYFDVVKVEDPKGYQIQGDKYWKIDYVVTLKGEYATEAQRDTAGAAIAREALTWVGQHDKGTNPVVAAGTLNTGTAAADEMFIEVTERGYYLVDTSTGSLGSLGTLGGTNAEGDSEIALTVDEKNIEPQFRADLWENYSETEVDGKTIVDFNGQSARVNGHDYACYNFGDAVYFTAQVTIGSGNGMLDYYIQHGEFDGIGPLLTPYELGTGMAGDRKADNLLSVAKKDANGNWVKLVEDTDYFRPLNDTSTDIKETVFLNSFSLNPGDQVAVTWKYKALSTGSSESNYGAQYEYSNVIEGYRWKMPYGSDNPSGILEPGGTNAAIDASLAYGLPIGNWSNWEEELAFYRNREESMEGHFLPGMDKYTFVFRGDSAQYSGLQFIKTDAEGKPLSGAKFTLYRDADCTQPVYFGWNNYDTEWGHTDNWYYQMPEQVYNGLNVSNGQHMFSEILQGSMNEVRGFEEMDNALKELYQAEMERAVAAGEFSEDWNTGGNPEEYQRALEYIAEYTKENFFTCELTDTDGVYTLVGLKVGTYYLKETQAPEGYNQIKPPIKVEVTATPYIYYVDGYDYPEDVERDEAGYPAYEGRFEDGVAVPAPEEAITAQRPERLAKIETRVINLTGTELPHTGGMGTTLLYIVGGVLVAGAGILLITKKRMSLEEE